MSAGRDIKPKQAFEFWLELRASSLTTGCPAITGKCAIAAKHRLEKLPEIGEIIDTLPRHIRHERFEVLPISFEHALLAGQLPGPHRDLFDRMLIAQARKGDLRVVTADPVFMEYGVKAIW
jgi:PIN domain nuclease of toxin-antitoxin system